MFNSIGVFKAWEKSKKDPEIHDFVKYLINWVAGTKIIFIGLMIVILFIADSTTQSFAILALVIAILTFFVGLYPLIRKMDKESQLEPKNYSTYLFIMILTFVVALLTTFFVTYFSSS